MCPSRVLIISTTFLPVVGGVQYFLKWLLDNLDRRLGQDLALEVHFGYPNDGADEHVRFRNIRVHNLGVARFGKGQLPRLALRVGHLLRQVRPQVVHCHSLVPDGLCVLMAGRLSGVRFKLVVTSHGQDLASIPSLDYGSLRSPKGRMLARYVTRRLSAHVVVSQYMVDLAVAAGTPKGAVQVIHNGVPLSGDYDFEEQERTDSSVDLPPLANGGLYILCLSSGRSLKNLHGLVEAMSQVRDKLGSSKLILACTGPLAQPVMELVEGKGLADRIVFSGELTGARKRAYFGASDVYCLPSHFEAFGIVALEAMKFGVAVVAAKVGGIPDFVEHDRNGLLIAPSEPAQIASALVRLYTTPSLRARLVECALETVERFSISAVVNHHIELYRRVLERRRT